MRAPSLGLDSTVCVDESDRLPLIDDHPTLFFFLINPIWGWRRDHGGNWPCAWLSLQWPSLQSCSPDRTGLPNWGIMTGSTQSCPQASPSLLVPASIKETENGVPTRYLGCPQRLRHCPAPSSSFIECARQSGCTPKCRLRPPRFAGQQEPRVGGGSSLCQQRQAREPSSMRQRFQWQQRTSPWQRQKPPSSRGIRCQNRLGPW